MAAFLFIRNYPNDRWFSVVFIVAGGVMVLCVGALSNPNLEKVTETMATSMEEKKENI